MTAHEWNNIDWKRRHHVDQRDRDPAPGFLKIRPESNRQMLGLLLA
jgi:hypothetical protein